jgi:glycosyltransferase involved in cell wall biosynthesis
VRLNRWFARRALRRALALMGAGEVVLWFAVPHPEFLVGQLGECMVVYYCIDDYAAHPGVDSERLRACDAELTRKADRVFVAPPALVAPKRAANASTVYSPHGVDAELFGRAMLAETEVPAAARALPPPIIGFFGSLAPWIDVALIAALARARPNYSLLLIGHVSTDVTELAQLPNVHLAGAQPYESLPNWAKCFDVAIIPYRQTLQVQNANPLKLREYLATGKPVVSTYNPEVARFAGLVRLADNEQTFIRQVDAALHDRDPLGERRRVDSVRNSTWDARVAEIIATVSADLRQRGVEPGPAPEPGR